MKKPWIISYLFILCTIGVAGQYDNAEIKVYDFQDGLSHRNTFKVYQDTSGFIWVGTINGLNRYDGYQFTHYHHNGGQNYLPVEMVNDLAIDPENQLWLSSPNYLTHFQPEKLSFDTLWIKQGGFVRRESFVPYSLFLDSLQQLWMASFDERAGDTYLQVLTKDKKLKDVAKVEGKYTKRSFAQLGNYIYVGAQGNELWKIRLDGTVEEKFNFKAFGVPSTDRRIVQLQTVEGKLWMLLLGGQVFSFDPSTKKFEPHPVNRKLQRRRLQTVGQSFWVDSNLDLWIGGQSVLLNYESATGSLFNYDTRIRQLVKNACTYRQIFKDQTGVVWVASDFGAIKIVPTDKLFTTYLSGGSEYCSNVYCSTRGITEDEQGNIYISYYNSIHKLDPTTDRIQLLFPNNNFFNYPFGLTYHENALWTGNGLQIDLNTLQVDTLFGKASKDFGAVLLDKSENLWFGYLNELYQYDPEKRILREFEDLEGKWDSLDGNISHLYQGKTNDYLWIGTLENGLFKVDPSQGRIAHYHTEGRIATLKGNQINATYEDDEGFLWIATGDGLHRLEIATDSLKVFTTADDLPNNFVNGILPEGDSILWISTDNGLCRFRIKREDCTNFFQSDGLSANEFNRVSFYKSMEGRMYFGGLDGVNAFYPSSKFLKQEESRREVPLVVTNFTRLDGSNDSLVSINYGINTGKPIELSYTDKVFSFRFTLANYKKPREIQYSYILEHYENKWSPPTALNLARYSNIPAGDYTFRVRARIGKEEWNSSQLAIPITIQEAYYNTWWFWALMAFVIVGSIYAVLRYRLYLSQLRERTLEAQVKERTIELEREKQKSEELLLNILPLETAEELKQFGYAKAKRHELVTVMFSDFKSFTSIAERLEPEDLVEEIDLCFRAFDEIIDKHRLEKIKTVGDAYICVGGMYRTDADEAVRVVKAALEIQEYLHAISVEKKLHNQPFFEARIGIHTGPVVAGIVGIKKFAYDIWGDTVNIASRMETNSRAGEVNVSDTTYKLVSPLFKCEFHGKFADRHENDIDMYFVKEFIGEPTTSTQKTHSE